MFTFWIKGWSAETLKSFQYDDSMELVDYLKLFVDTKKELFKGCEIIIHIICTGTIFFSCELILDSYVSMHEYKKDKHRAGRIYE